MNTFEVEIPKKDHPVVITVKQREGTNATYDLYYCEGLCGAMFCNEHHIWIYEPHHAAALLLDEAHIQHLGKAIGQHK